MPLRAGLCLALLIAARGVAADPVLLKWKFKEGDTFFVVNDMTIDLAFTIMNQKTNQKIEQSGVIRYTVKKVGEDGSVVLEQTIVGLKQKGDQADAKLTQKMKGSTFTVSLGPDNKLTKFEGYKDFLDRVSDGNPMTRQILESVMSKETMQKGIQETFTAVPGKKVAVGDKWVLKEDKLSLGPLGDLAASSVYSYKGKDARGERMLDKVGITGDFKYSPPGNQPQGLPFKISKGNLDVKSFTGDYWFDTAIGRLAEAKASMKMTGKMTFNFDGREVEVEMDQTLTMESRVTDKARVLDE